MSAKFNPSKEGMVIAVSAGALLDLRREKKIFKTRGPEAYERHMERTRKVPLKPGAAFSFIRKILDLAVSTDPQKPLVEVVLFTGNNQKSAGRILHSIQHYNLRIEIGALLSGNHHNVELLKQFCMF